jgi:hypothetical protein
MAAVIGPDNAARMARSFGRGPQVAPDWRTMTIRWNDAREARWPLTGRCVAYATKAARRDGSRRTNGGSSRASRDGFFVGGAVGGLRSARTCDLRKLTRPASSFEKGRHPCRRYVRMVDSESPSNSAAVGVSMKSKSVDISDANRRKALDRN